MISLIRSVFAFVLGLALAFFGLVHSVTHYPGKSAFSGLVAALPTVGAVLFLVLGVVACLTGVGLLAWSTRHVRYRWRYVREVTSRPRYRSDYTPAYHSHPQHEMEEDAYEGNGAYR